MISTYCTLKQNAVKTYSLSHISQIHGRIDFYKDICVFPNSHTFILWISTSSAYILFPFHYVSFILNYFLELSPFSSPLYILSLWPKSLFYIGTFQMNKTIVIYSCVWESWLYFSQQREPFFLTCCLSTIKFCIWNKRLRHVYVGLQYFFIVLNTAYYDARESISF